jgi:hypothetical protein
MVKNLRLLRQPSQTRRRLSTACRSIAALISCPMRSSMSVVGATTSRNSSLPAESTTRMICSENGLNATALLPPSAAVSATEFAARGLIGRTPGAISRA